ncbi:xanthine dehydrogenase accessory protein XdhC [Sneathiella litorea]|uniref:Xanthine dehydrogenase accessory protein XdhC n=1 Tax=Sneathiella litorea TaxID=2606216 RepID=A0A6L8W880_9PROT|nr:xanthine dehydrogenase accessory protein XdhC [Sneathiella litorea]MZR31331.1 xanthine dehydrogenase accessory protein XdhC [Sneathiella litorea]
MSNWSEIVNAYDAGQDGPAILVTVGRIKGSTPRETGANMLITATNCFGTIGGGRLEHLAISEARSLLNDADKSVGIHELPLGPELAQCCGGYVELLLNKFQENEARSIVNRLKCTDKNSVLLFHWSQSECRHQIICETDSLLYLDKPLQTAIERRFTLPGTEIIESGKTTDKTFTLVQSLQEAEFHVTVFGAGHVGRALVTVLSSLPCKISWIDSREIEFPDKVSANVKIIVTDSPVSAVADSPTDSYFLVMTHSHQLDLEICEKLLTTRKHAAFIGLIGSRTKKVRFEKRLATRRVDTSVIARLTCPIGLPELNGKRPAEIALSVATDLLRRHYNSRDSKVPDDWSEIQNSP